MKRKEKRIHAFQKPVAMYRWIYEKYVKDGWKLLDTHGGSMSSVVAAADAVISIDCCEIDAEYFGKEYKGNLGINYDQCIVDFLEGSGCDGYEVIGTVHDYQAGGK